MALILKGGEYFATEPLTVPIIKGLKALALRRPVKVNGIELHPQDLDSLVSEAVASGLPIRLPQQTYEAS